MKYFLSGLFLALFVGAGALGLIANTAKAQPPVIQEAIPCSWGEVKDCYNGGQNDCCPGTKGDG
jgi:hypothetical protein